jgi:hypothetical protein
MISYNLNHTYELDNSFIDYLQSSTKLVNSYESILHALKDLNNKGSKKPIIFVKTKCSNKGYACLFCDNDNYESSIGDLENIIKLHIFKKEQMKKWHSELDSVLYN